MNAKDKTAAALPNPKTLMEAVKVFADQTVALRFMVALRWPGGVCCPRCGSERVRFIQTRSVWECREAHPCRRFSVKTGTIMEDSPLPLDKWLVGIWLEANAKNSVSSYEVHRSLGITQKSAWFMQQRIRLAMQQGSFDKMGGVVEADETFIGGLARNMHKSRRERVVKGTGGAHMTPVMGLLERHGEKGKSTVRAMVVENRQRATIHAIIHKQVEPGTTLYTDAHDAYGKLAPDFMHAFVDHAEKYVDGAVHTNGLENFWALFKRCIKGTHVSVEPFHLFRYLDAECYRFNNRKTEDRERFIGVVQSMPGKRLTYKRLIGRDNPEGRLSDGRTVVGGELPAN
jgi:transposase-like protein